MEPQEFTTVAEVAARWEVSKMTVYRLVQDGQLSAVQIGGRSIRIPVEAVVAYERTARTGQRVVPA